jgi:hypothetical protein
MRVLIVVASQLFERAVPVVDVAIHMQITANCDRAIVEQPQVASAPMSEPKLTHRCIRHADVLTPSPPGNDAVLGISLLR